MSWVNDFDWQKQFVPTIKKIVGPQLLEVAPLELDVSEATDMLILRGRARGVCIGCRIRRPEYAERYPFDFTIRSLRNSGAKTELEKIIEGWGDLIFYGHQKERGSIDIDHWFLIDLAALRAHFILGFPLPCDVPNGDGTFFKPFDVRDFKGHLPKVVIAGAAPRKFLSNGEASRVA